jgi:hypothetical protein
MRPYCIRFFSHVFTRQLEIYENENPESDDINNDFLETELGDYLGSWDVRLFTPIHKIIHRSQIRIGGEDSRMINPHDYIRSVE